MRVRGQIPSPGAATGSNDGHAEKHEAADGDPAHRVQVVVVKRLPAEERGRDRCAGDEATRPRSQLANCPFLIVEAAPSLLVGETVRVGMSVVRSQAWRIAPPSDGTPVLRPRAR